MSRAKKILNLLEEDPYGYGEPPTCPRCGSKDPMKPAVGTVKHIGKPEKKIDVWECPHCKHQMQMKGGEIWKVKEVSL